jgi:hypothetical protein
MFKVENERGNRERERNGGESIHRKGKKNHIILFQYSAQGFGSIIIILPKRFREVILFAPPGVY